MAAREVRLPEQCSLGVQWTKCGKKTYCWKSINDCFGALRVDYLKNDRLSVGRIFTFRFMRFITLKVALVSGFWGQNIGNAFFNIGGKWVLDEVFGPGNVQFIQDHPAYRTFYNQKKGAPRNYANIHQLLNVEYVVLQGPMLTSNFKYIWGESFKVFRERGIKVILLGAAFFKYVSNEFEDVRRFLEEFPPFAISTRDEHTYDVIEKWGFDVYNGIDSAFFVPKVFSPHEFVKEYYVFNFDRFPEPSVAFESGGRVDYEFDFQGCRWQLSTPALQYYFSKLGKAQAYIGHLLDRRKLPESLLGKVILRPEHRYYPHMTRKIYQHPNSFVSDEVFTYLSVYANSKLTLSDRVHACVMTLAFGNPAMLFTISPRQALFSRLGLSNIRKKPVDLDPGYLAKEQQGVVDNLKRVVGGRHE